MIWKLKEKWGWGWEPPRKGRCGAEGSLPTVCSGSSQEGDKGRDAGDPGGQGRETTGSLGDRWCLGVMEGRGNWGVRETRRQEGGKGWVTKAGNQELKGLGQEDEEN